jgi:phosphohistidine phosphatase
VRRLYLLRHAKSSWNDATLEDHERPLAGRGRRAAKLMAKHLRAEGVCPEIVLCSSAVRTRETLDRLRPALGDATRVEIERELYAASAEALLGRLRRLPPDVESAMLIGHNPGLEELALSLAKGGERRDELAAKYPTAALATLSFEGEDWADLEPGGAQLEAYVKPRELEER